jgi:hypothetical protein
MAIKRKAKEPIPDYPSLFGELGAEGASLSTSKEARRSRFPSRTGKRKPTERESREKRNTGLWESLYPIPKKTVGEKKY